MRALYRVWTSALAADSVDRILRCAAQQASEEARTFTTAADLDAVGPQPSPGLTSRGYATS